ncbi:MAG: FtsB family cell division protein [Longimicrobiales bacterium]
MKKFLFPGLLGLCLYFALAEGEYSLLDVKRAEAELVAREAELPVIRGQIDSLTERIKALEGDDAALERLARERYGFIRDGEYLYRLAPEADSTEAPHEPS